MKLIIIPEQGKSSSDIIHGTLFFPATAKKKLRRKHNFSVTLPCTTTHGPFLTRELWISFSAELPKQTFLSLCLYLQIYVRWIRMRQITVKFRIGNCIVFWWFTRWPCIGVDIGPGKRSCYNSYLPFNSGPALQCENKVWHMVILFCEKNISKSSLLLFYLHLLNTMFNSLK